MLGFIAAIVAGFMVLRFLTLCDHVRDIHDKLFDDKNDRLTNNKR